MVRFFPRLFTVLVKRALFLLILTSVVIGASAQNSMVRGFVRDFDDGEPMMGVNVVLTNDEGLLLGGSSDFQGLFVIPSISPGTYYLRATFIGYRAILDTLTLAAGEIRSYNIEMAFETANLDEVVVETDREGAGAAAVVAGLQTIRPQDIDAIPSPDVSGDLATYLQTLPGVVTSGDQGGQFFVRGGEPTQNLVLIDGALVYQPFHLIGFYSAFPSSIINVTDFHAGGYGAQYGGRLSSVLSVKTRNGNKRRFSGELTAGPFLSGGRIEGPLVTNKVSVLLSGRVSVIDQGVEQYLDEDLPYKFSDMFGKIHADLTANSQLSITALKTYDRGIIDLIAAEDTLDITADQIIWRNQVISARYLLLPTSLPMQAEILISSSDVENTFGPEADPSRTSSSNRFSLSTNVTHFGANFDISWGLFLNAMVLKVDIANSDRAFTAEKENVSEVGAYIETELTISKRLRIRPGLRIVSYPSNSTNYLEPRLRLIYDLGFHSFSAAAGVYHQEVIGLTDRRDAGDVFTAWTVAERGSVPEAVHLLLGYQIEFGNSVNFSTEGYYKKLSNLSIARWSAFPQFTTDFQSADGDVRGFDMRLEISKGIFYGFVNYGYTVVEYEAKQQSIALWFGTQSLVFSPPHDRRHQVNALVSLSKRGFTFSARWQYGSGTPFSESLGFDEFVLLDGPVDVLEEPGETRVLFGRPFEGRLPDYHRLDLSLDKKFTLAGRSKLTVQLGVTNVYDRNNLFYVDLFTLRTLNQLPRIPSLSAKLDF